MNGERMMGNNTPKPKTVQELADRLQALENQVSALRDAGGPVAPSLSKGTLSDRLILSASEQVGMAAQKALGGVAVLRLLLSVAVMIKLAVKSGWLTPDRQIITTLSLGLVLVGISFRIEKMDFPFKQYIPGAGVGVLILVGSVYWGYFGYGVLDRDLFFLGAFLTSLIAIFLIYFQRNELYLHVALVVAYGVPYALYKLGYGLTVVGGYFVLLSALFSLVAVLIHERHLHRLACYAGIGLFSFIGGMALEFKPEYADQHRVMAMMLSLQFLFLTVGLFVHSLYYKELLTVRDAWSYFPILVFFYGTLYAFVSYVAPILSPVIALTVALICIILYAVARKKLGELNSGPMIFTFAGIVFFHALYLQLLPHAYAPWIAIVVIGTSSWWMRTDLFFVLRDGFIFRLGFGLLCVLEYGRTVYFDLMEPSPYRFVVSLFFAAALILGRRLVGNVRIQSSLPGFYALVSAAALMFVAGLFSLNTLVDKIDSSLLGLVFLGILGAIFGLQRRPILFQVTVATGALVLGKMVVFDGVESHLWIILAGVIYGGTAYVLIRNSLKWNA